MSSAVPRATRSTEPARRPHLREAVPVEERSRWTQVGGLDVHARSWVGRDQAAAPPLVLVHGLGVASRMCRPLARHLAASYPVHAPDLPGFGESDHPDGVLDVAGLGASLAAWIRAAGTGPAVLVGTSLGCSVALEAARVDPGCATGLVLGSPIVDAS
jgi:pimeloyl-ACP methyl ester carboxylesterase